VSSELKLDDGRQRVEHRARSVSDGQFAKYEIRIYARLVLN
jgi:hypothetical protein